jgi:effector-binding domain-containing protein
MDSQLQETTLSARHGVAIRRTLPMADLAGFFGKAFAELGAYVGTVGGQIAGPPLARYHSVDAEGVDVEAVFPLAAPVAGRGDIQAIELPAGPAVQVLHTGPYDEVGPVYDAIEAWLAEHGRERAGPSCEVYLNEPGDDPSQLQTLVVQPITA